MSDLLEGLISNGWVVDWFINYTNMLNYNISLSVTYLKKYLNCLNLKPLNKWSILNPKVDVKGILKPIGGWKWYFGANRWMKGNYVPFSIL